MKKLLFSLLTIAALSSAISLQAQTDIPATEPVLEKPNIIKFNVSGVVLGYYTLQYERVINPKQSAAISIGIAPEMDLPFKQTLLNIFGDNAQATEAINTTTLSSTSITPEYRFYTGVKGAPFGFYASTFIRYTHMTHNGTYEFNLSDGAHHPVIETTFNGVGLGEMIGVQWKIGSSMTLDWWIIGPYIGYLNGSSHGDDDRVIRDDDKVKLESDIEAIQIPGWTIDATVVDNPTTGLGDVTADLKGIFYGARVFGICLGYRF